MSANDFNPNDISLIAPCEQRNEGKLQPLGMTLSASKISAPPTDMISVSKISSGSVAVVNTASMVEVKKFVNAARVEVKIINSSVKLPAYQSEMAAGIDLVAAVDEPIVLQPGDQAMIPSGIAVSIRQRNIAAFIFPRSSMGKSGFALANTVGVIDADYQGELIIIGANRNTARSRKAIIIEPGQRIAQLVFMPIIVAQLVQVNSFAETTERGAGGFGSTGA